MTPDDRIDIPELGISTRRRGDLAAFWDGFGAGQRGEPVPKVLDFEDPGVWRRAHARGVSFGKQL